MRRVDREGPIHRSVLAYLRTVLPAAVIHHSPNAIGRSGASIARQIQLNTLMGTVKGFPDLLIIDHMGVGLMEVKAAGNYPDKEQRALHEKLESLGVSTAVVRSIDDAEAALREWGWL